MPLPSTERFPLPEALTEKSVWADRTATRELLGHNQRGVEIPIGYGDGRITPGELLKLALVACAGMSMDLSVGRRIGEDFDLRVWGHGDSDEATNRFDEITEQLQVSVDGMEQEELATLQRVITQAVRVGCTVERTVVAGAVVHHEFLGEGAGATQADSGGGDDALLSAPASIEAREDRLTGDLPSREEEQ